MADPTPSSRRGVTLTRLRKARFRATNRRGGTIEVGEAEDGAFTPVELLLVAIAACTAIDVDYITAKRVEADTFDLAIDGEKVRDEHGNRLVDIQLAMDVLFPQGPEGDTAREVLAAAVQRSHDRLCTVGRTVIVGADITASVNA